MQLMDLIRYGVGKEFLPTGWEWESRDSGCTTLTIKGDLVVLSDTDYDGTTVWHITDENLKNAIKEILVECVRKASAQQKIDHENFETRVWQAVKEVK